MSLQTQYEHRKDMEYEKEEIRRSQESEFWELVDYELDEIIRYAIELNDIDELKRNICYIKSHLDEVVELINKFEGRNEH